MGSILVLGGAGYIGSHTVYELIEAGKQCKEHFKKLRFFR